MCLKLVYIKPRKVYYCIMKRFHAHTCTYLVEYYYVQTVALELPKSYKTETVSYEFSELFFK